MYEKIWVNFTGPFVRSIVEGLSLDKSVYVCTYDGAKDLNLIHRYLANINNENRDYTFDKIATEICRMFLNVNALERGKLKQIENQKIGTAEKIKSYIDSMVVPNINLDDLSKFFDLDKGYIIHRFKDKFGISPYKYISRKRIEAARKMLADNNMKIGEIASALGYNGTQHFSSSFKKATGMTPSEFLTEYK